MAKRDQKEEEEEEPDDLDDEKYALKLQQEEIKRAESEIRSYKIKHGIPLDRSVIPRRQRGGGFYRDEDGGFQSERREISPPAPSPPPPPPPSHPPPASPGPQTVAKRDQKEEEEEEPDDLDDEKYALNLQQEEIRRAESEIRAYKIKHGLPLARPVIPRRLRGHHGDLYRDEDGGFQSERREISPPAHSPPPPPPHKQYCKTPLPQALIDPHQVSVCL